MTRLTFSVVLRALTREPGAILALALIFGFAITVVGIFGDPSQ